MNLGLSQEGARLVYDALTYYFKSTASPQLLLEMYEGVDLQEIMLQLQIIMKIGCSEQEYQEMLNKLKGDK